MRATSLVLLTTALFVAACSNQEPAQRSTAVPIIPEPPAITAQPVDPIRPLQVHGQDFVDAAGHTVRFWGANLCAVYPADRAHAEGIAAALADRSINLVRPHHMLRPSRDWAPDLAGGSLSLYANDARQVDPVALERFDLLNAALRTRGIYLMLSAHWSRSFMPGDAAILDTDAADQAAWQAAMQDLRSWPWQKAFDPMKMLPVFDERAALVTEESVRGLLTHVNPHTGLAYGRDPQVLTYECINEFSSEYTILCGNRFPPYFEKRLQSLWEAYAARGGFTAGDLWKPASTTVARERTRFLRGLDEAWMQRISAVIRSTGCTAPIAFSNLWRGDSQLAMEAASAGYTENHSYGNPMVADTAEDFIRSVGRCAVVGKPFIIGELNQSEGDRGKAEAQYRTMLPLATAAYGSLQGWSGVAWFAWNHGNVQRPFAHDGWAQDEERRPALGSMVGDGVMLDHLRTASLLFRRGLVAPSTQPITVTISGELARPDYHGLMGGKTLVRPGWQSVHAVRYAYGEAPADTTPRPWLTSDAPSPMRSDTGQVVKDVARRQLTVASPSAEAFSGCRDAAAPAGLSHLQIASGDFATVILVADDGKPLASSASLVLSRSATYADGSEAPAPDLRLQGLPSGDWWLRITRPRQVCNEQHLLVRAADGSITLPAAAWHEAELRRTP
jgi:hypothetical protein